MTSSGAADAGKLVVLDASGALDSTIAAGTTQEASEDYTGNMFSGNTETRITATYDDTLGKINLIVEDMNDDQPDDDSEVPACFNCQVVPLLVKEYGNPYAPVMRLSKK